MFNINLLAISVVCGLLAVVSAGYENHKMNMTCKGEALLDKKSFWIGKKECVEEFMPQGSTTASSADTEEAKTEMKKKWKELMGNTCFHVCMMKQQHLLKADGTYDAEGTEKMITSVFPEKFHADVKKANDDCASANSQTFSMDNKCDGYKAFMTCRSKQLKEICDWKQPEM